MNRTILVVLGTRPDAIKLAPVLRELRARDVGVYALSTGQHQELLAPLEGLLDLQLDRSLDVMRAGASLTELHSAIVGGVDAVLGEVEPALVVVQGDTSTAFGGALAAFYREIPVAHVEAGLRTGSIHQPWPEEFHRQSIARLAELHFAPTEAAAENLRREVVGGEIWVVGNTVVDALRWLEADTNQAARSFGGRPYVLVTCHRREQAGDHFERAARAIREVAEARRDLDFILPVHPNPVVRAAVDQGLEGVRNLKLVPPMPYDSFVAALRGAEAVLTDSGGVQEEASALGRPVLVMREVSDRPEAVALGGAAMVGLDPRAILSALANPPMGDARDVFGDGNAAARIADRLVTWTHD